MRYCDYLERLVSAWQRPVLDTRSVARATGSSPRQVLRAMIWLQQHGAARRAGVLVTGRSKPRHCYLLNVPQARQAIADRRQRRIGMAMAPGQGLMAACCNMVRLRELRAQLSTIDVEKPMNQTD